MIFYIVGGLVVIFFASMLGAKKKPDTGGNNAPIYSVITGAPVYQTPIQPGKESNQPVGPTLAQLGVKPALFVTGNLTGTGSVSFVSKYASSVRGIGIDGSVLFDKPIFQDGPGSAVYRAGIQLDHINVHGPGGDITVQVYYPTEDAAPTSAGIRDTPIVTNLSTENLPWPADDTIAPTPFEPVEV